MTVMTHDVILNKISRSVSLQIAATSSWHARYTVLTYLQVMAFYNLFTFMSDQKAVNDVRALVIQLLEDEQLEVNFTTVP